MLSSLRVIHPPSSDNPTNLPVLVLSIDNRSFIFNVPEGLTRVLLQRGAKGASKRLQGVFVPRVGYEECGGLPGLLMSLADQQRTALQLYGPPVLSQLLATARVYAKRDTLQLDINEVDLQGSLSPPGTSSAGKGKQAGKVGQVAYQDKDVAVVAIPVFPENYSLPETDKPDMRPLKKQKNGTAPAKGLFGPSARVKQCLDTMFASTSKAALENGNTVEETPDLSLAGTDEASAGEVRYRQRLEARRTMLDPPPLAPVQLTDAADGQAPALIYLIKGSAKRGKFDAARAKAMGLADTKQYGILTAGKDVEIERPKGWQEWDEKKRGSWFGRCKVLQNLAKGRLQAKPQGFDQHELASAELERITIRSADVVAPPIPGSSVVQVYLPSPDYLASFLSDAVQSHFSSLDEDPHAIVHAVHPAILQDARYQAFMKHFGDKTNHIVSTRSFVPDKLGYPSAALATLRMSDLDKALFRVPQYSLTPQSSLQKLGLDGTNVKAAGLDTMIQLHPRRAPEANESSAPDFDWPLDSSESIKLASFQVAPKIEAQMAAHVKAQQRWAKYQVLVAQLQEQEHQRDSLRMDSPASSNIKLTTLGTGSALPSKYRNVSGTLLHLPNEEGYVLLDAGEGTYGQLCRRFGGDVDRIIRDLRLVFLSHAHGDHHMGMSRLLAERKKLNVDAPLFVLSNTFTRWYLLEVSAIEPLDICISEQAATAKRGVIFLDNEHFDFHHGVRHDPDAHSAQYPAASSQDQAWRAYLLAELQNAARRQHVRTADVDAHAQKSVKYVEQSRKPLREAVRAQLDRLQSALGGARVHTAEVDHRASRCYGIVLRGPDWSLTYSGDTRPCENLVRAGKGVEVLVHEATFEDGEETMATDKGHSTVGQALDVARRMGARRLLLTHFSQRYPKLPRISDVVATDVDGDRSMNGQIEPSVGIAFDLMTVTPRDIGKTERYREALQVLFDAEGEGIEDDDDEVQGEKKDGQDGKGGSRDDDRSSNAPGEK